jgi:hypothetical protein
LTEDDQENEGASKSSDEGLFRKQIRSAPKAVEDHRTPRRFATGDDYRASRERFGVRLPRFCNRPTILKQTLVTFVSFCLI